MASLAPAPQTPTQASSLTQNISSLPSIERIKPHDYAGKHRSVNLLEEENWSNWQTDIELHSLSAI